MDTLCPNTFILPWKTSIDLPTLKIKQMLPAALEIAMEEDVEFRRGLPLDYLTYMGVQNSDQVMPSFTSLAFKKIKLIKICVCII